MSEQTAGRVTRRQILILVFGFALASGLLEAALVLAREEFFGKAINLGPRLVWMIPAMNLIWFSVMAGLLALLAFLVRIQPRLILGCVLFLTLLLIGLVFDPGLHWAASALLATGIAFRASPVLAARWNGILQGTRRTLPWLAALVLVMAVGVETRARLHERKQLAGLPAAPANAPNVLLLVLDTVRGWNMSLHGYGRSTTPALERWARRGTVFNLAISTASWTLPSHASMFTGRWPYELSTNWSTPLDSVQPTLAEHLAGRGYLTGGFVANLLYCSRQHGLDRGFTRYEDFPVTPGEMLVSSSLGRFLSNRSMLRRLVGYHDMLGRKSAADINQAVLDWIPDPGGRPFFAFLNYYDAHEPYLPPDSVYRRFSTGVSRKNHPLRHQLHEASRRGHDRMTPSDIQGEIDAYDGTIAYVDQQIDVLLQELERRGILEQTLVIITSDHGEHFGEHKLFGHGHRLYRPSLEVPLLLRFPGRVPEGHQVRQPVSLRDIPATVLDLLDPGPAGPFPGASLRRHWQGPAQDLVLSEVYRGKGRNYVSAFAEGVHYLRNPDGSEEVYSLQDDRLEEHNLAADSAMAPLIARVRASIPREALQRSGRPETDVPLD